MIVPPAVDWDRLRRAQREGCEARARERHSSPQLEHLTHAFFDLYADLPDWERHARTMAYAIEHEPVYLFEHDLLVGTIYQGCPGACSPTTYPPGADSPWWPHSVREMAHRQVAERLPDHAALVAGDRGGLLMHDGAAPGHVSWQWERLLAEGVEGLLERCRQAERAAADEPARQFAAGVRLAWSGALAWNARHVAALEQKVAESAGELQAHWQTLLDTCRRVPAQPARTFREAVQAYHFQHLAVMFENPFGGNGPGLLDRGLGPYLERDLANGTIDLDEARALVEGLLLKFHERLFPRDGWVETVMVGGLDASGAWAGNALSELLLELYLDLPQTHPAIYVRLADNAPERFVDLTVRYFLEGGNRAQILSDEAVLKALTGATGLAPDDASRYICGGCMELAPHGLNSDMNFTFMHSVAKTAELVLSGGVCLKTGQRRFEFDRDLTGFATFDELYVAFEAELRRELHLAFQRLDIWSEAYAARRPAYLISGLVGDCLSRGRGMHEGGARYHDYGAAPMGVINTADALYAVQQAVYEQGCCTAGELLAALRADFVGHEALRQKLLAIPKYGAEHPGADAMADRVLRTLCAVYDSYRNRLGGRVKPMIFNFVWTPAVGQGLGASPDGRRAGEPVSHGLTPQGRGMQQGLTAAINSATALPLAGIAGGSTTMWDIAPGWASPAIVKAVLKAFMARGGQIFQGNATDVAELERALASPEEYPNLMVRVGGFSAKFLSLDPAVRREIVERYRHRQV